VRSSYTFNRSSCISIVFASLADDAAAAPFAAVAAGTTFGHSSSGRPFAVMR
jgi:hypothetical protein